MVWARLAGPGEKEKRGKIKQNIDETRGTALGESRAGSAKGQR